MSVTDKEMTIGELVAQRPSRARVFEKFGIDYCCGGGEPLHDLCSRKGIDVQSVLSALSESDNATPHHEDIDWTKASIKDLVDNIEHTHHSYLKRELPRLTALVNKVAAVHHVRHPEVLEVRDRFNAMRSELESHCSKEEEIFFPVCRNFEEPGGQPLNADVAQQIKELESEHDGTGETLEKLRALTHGYSVPADGCNTYRAMLDGLRDLEADLHIHVNKENYALYPKIREAEASRHCDH